MVPVESEFNEASIDGRTEPPCADSISGDFGGSNGEVDSVSTRGRLTGDKGEAEELLEPDPVIVRNDTDCYDVLQVEVRLLLAIHTI